MLLCVEPICKKPDGGLWTDAFALRVVERNVRASLDRWRNVIIPQPHPGEVLGAAERKRNALKDIKNLNNQLDVTLPRKFAHGECKLKLLTASFFPH